MARLTKADAARHLGISRTTLYKLIDQGKVSPTPDGLIDDAELVRVAPFLDVHRERTRTPLARGEMDAATTASEHRERPPSAQSGRPLVTDDERQVTSTYLALVDTLRTQLDTMRHELEAARAERQAAHAERQEAREERVLLLQMLQDMQHRYDRLLEAPRPRPEPRTPPPPAVPTVPQDPVLTEILRWRQEGMSLRAIAARLNAEGVPTRSGKGRWYQSNLSRELRRVERGR